MLPLLTVKTKVEELGPLADILSHCHSAEEKLQTLQSYTKKIQKSIPFEEFEKLNIHSKIILESLYAIDQIENIFQNKFENPILNHVLKTLEPIEKFYDSIGGIVGYHYTFLKLLIEKESYCLVAAQGYEKAPGLDISEDTLEVRKTIQAGIKSLPIIAEIYPVAGAADRLNLVHEETNEPLPAAEMHFLEHNLLEILFRDLTAREYLYYKMTGEKIVTPVVLMVSNEKNNHDYVKKLLKKFNWFDRPKKFFFIVIQPLVPMIRLDGKWAIKQPGELFLKPGGHGALWKIAHDQGAFSWLKKHNRKKALVRQINNPIAGVDHSLLAMIGLGCNESRHFGFLSCERLVNSSEGMDLLIETTDQSNYQYKISNIEYTDFEKQGILDSADPPEGLYSKFPANTNILFADIDTIEPIAKKHPLPGLLINLKSFINCHENGLKREVQAGRLESTMQNIADFIIYESAEHISDAQKLKLPTYILYNNRHKTISVAKKLYIKGSPSISETPEGCFYDIMFNAHKLLLMCGYTLPAFNTEKEFLKLGPSFIFTYHPALGPLYAIIQQKLLGGTLHPQSELKLEIAEIKIKNINLKGSLQIFSPLQSFDKPGQCVLKNVQINNKGISNWTHSLWKSEIHRTESLLIKIEEGGIFIAEDVNFIGNHTIIVKKNERMTAKQDGKKIKYFIEKTTTPLKDFTYSWDDDSIIKIVENL